KHNWQNIAFAYALCRARGVDATRIIDGILSFPGLAHRQERLGTIDGVVFVNDSKATNAEASAKALSAYQNIYWIVGGKPKEGGIAGLEAFYPNIKKAYLIGAATNEFADALGTDLPWEKCQTLDVATRAAFEDARQHGDDAPVVMLTPACASFDQFKSFEARGDAFRDIYAHLATNAQERS
ncbi:MAG TPA: UDP-N-acetylmuramoyl-L-alanine--D-glutamate ligase, partial [Thalassospira lucentensis]|nr:UDP-N-acetylmuramoyl-L-alanine--D-glutamate ligase [Thalassospira lucentensis]